MAHGWRARSLSIIIVIFLRRICHVLKLHRVVGFNVEESLPLKDVISSLRSLLLLHLLERWFLRLTGSTELVLVLQLWLVLLIAGWLLPRRRPPLVNVQAINITKNGLLSLLLLLLLLLRLVVAHDRGPLRSDGLRWIWTNIAIGMDRVSLWWLVNVWELTSMCLQLADHPLDLVPFQVIGVEIVSFFQIKPVNNFFIRFSFESFFFDGNVMVIVVLRVVDEVVHDCESRRVVFQQDLNWHWVCEGARHWHFC